MDKAKFKELQRLAASMRYNILAMTTEAGSGHPTSSLSAADLMAGLFFSGIFKFDPDRPGHPNNDRLIFSKGHASPLLYALWAAAGRLSPADLMSYRKFGSPLEGHPAIEFPYTEAATGALGQGLPIGFGMALNAKYIDRLPYRTYVLLGDSEMSEGSCWEAIQLAAHYKLDNLVGIIDVNRLGQRGETMYGHHCSAYRERVSSFGWETLVLDGHSFAEIVPAYEQALRGSGRPVMLIAKTIKGKGVSFVEDENGFHGKALSRKDFERAVKEMGDVDPGLTGDIAHPEDLSPPQAPLPREAPEISYPPDKPVATRKAYGNALVRIYPLFPGLVSLDGEVSNSTYSEIFQHAYPQCFFEMYIAEQNMVGAALGLARRGKLPFVSTFAAFLTRAFDQIRMSWYSGANIKFVGSHAGVSIGQDGPSQMGLEDIAMFRALPDAVVLYPADAVSTEKLVEQAARHTGIAYIRTTREATPILYRGEDTFSIGGSRVLRRSPRDCATVIGAGITLHEALAAYDMLHRQGRDIRVVDLYSVKPLDEKTLRDAARETPFIVTVEDHYADGGIGDAVRAVLPGIVVHSLAVRKKPRSGVSEELLDYEGISRNAIASSIMELLEQTRKAA